MEAKGLMVTTLALTTTGMGHHSWLRTVDLSSRLTLMLQLGDFHSALLRISMLEPPHSTQIRVVGEAKLFKREEFDRAHMHLRLFDVG